jgi:hypothetical protein
MLVKNVIRGNSVTFTSSFLDANNNVMTPEEPAISLYYKSNNAYVTVSYDMLAVNATAWTATWDSSNADVGIVEWHITGGASTPVAMDGDFRILSNKANGGSGAT